MINSGFYCLDNQNQYVRNLVLRVIIGFLLLWEHRGFDKGKEKGNT
jgi:hypothetical protein